MQSHRPSVPAITLLVFASTATTCAPKIPVSDLPVDGEGIPATANRIAGKTRPLTVRRRTVALGTEYETRILARSSSRQLAIGCPRRGPVTEKCTGRVGEMESLWNSPSVPAAFARMFRMASWAQRPNVTTRAFADQYSQIAARASCKSKPHEESLQPLPILQISRVTCDGPLSADKAGAEKSLDAAPL